MKKNVGFISLLIAIFTLLSIFSVSAEALEKPILSFTSFDVVQGETFTTTLYFEKNSNVCQSALTMLYDADKVELLDCQPNEDSRVGPTVNTTVNGQITLTFANGTNINTELALVDITFKVCDTLAEGSYDLLKIADGKGSVGRLNSNTIVENVDFTYNTPKLNIYRAGDINLDHVVNSADAVYIYRYVVHLSSGREGSPFYLPYYSNINDYNDHQKFILKIADAHHDNLVDISDAVSILRHAAQFTTELLGNRINVNFYDGDNKPYISKSVVFGGSLATLPEVPAKEGYSAGKWSLSPSEYVEPDFRNLEANVSVFPIYDDSSHTTKAVDYYKKILTDKYYGGNLSTGLSSSLTLVTTLKYEAGYKAEIIWSSDSNYILNSTTGQFTKPTYPQELNLTAKIISYDNNDMIEAEDSISFKYKVQGIYQTPTKASIEDFLKFYFTDETDGKYRVNYDVKPLTKINNTVIPVDGAMYDNFEIRLDWYQNVNGTLQPISQIKRTTASQVNDYVAVATFNGKPLDGDGKIYLDNVEVTAIDQLEIKNYIINQIAAKQGTSATDGKKLWNNDDVYNTTVAWETGNPNIAYVADNVIKLKDNAITGTTLPLIARVSYGGKKEIVLSYNLTVSCDNAIIKAPENMDPGLYKAIKMELEDTIGYRGDLTSAALTNVKFVNLDLSKYQKQAEEYQILRAKDMTLPDTYPEITSFRGLSYCKNLRTLNISGIAITDGSMNQISTLSYLEALIARGCNLDNLSDGGAAVLKNATGLKMIDLTDNNFTSLDSVFATGVRYGSLREVYLSKNKLTDINALSRAPMMTYLSLSENGLTTAGTASIENYPYLQYLSLANNNIDSVEHLKGLRCLEELRLQNNKLSNVNDLRRLVNLEILYLGHNNVLDVAYFNALTKLQVLYVNDNRIVDISALRDLSKLEAINVSNNRISSLSTLINYKSTLTEVYAENNKITDFSFINGASNLHILMLSGNKAELAQDNMVSWLSGLPKIQVLTLSDIRLTGLEFLNSMTELVRLDVANCGLTAFSGETSNIQAIADRYEKLRVLNISNNDFSDDKNEILKLRNNTLLSVFYADNICNSLDARTLTYSMTELKYISLENCGITSIDWLSKLNNLIYVDLAGNNISNVDLEAHISNASIKTLKELYLDTKVPCTFKNAYSISDFNVEKLSLAGVTVGQIERIPNLENIKYLNLDNTGLPNLTGSDAELADMYSIERFKTMNTLDISNIDADISPVENMPSVKTVYAVGATNSKRFYENNLHALQRLCNKGVECYLYDKNTVYEPKANNEGTEILKLIEDISCDIKIASENVFSDNNPLLISKINDFDIAWTVSNSKNYEVVNNRLSVKDYSGIDDEALTVTATIKVYPNQETVSREFTINTHILRASASYYELVAQGYSEDLTRDSKFDVVVRTKAEQTEGFTNPVKPVEDGVQFSYAAETASGTAMPYSNIVSAQPISELPNNTLSAGVSYTVMSNAPLDAKLTIKVDIYHLDSKNEKAYDIKQIVLPVTIASRTFTANFEINGGSIVDKNGMPRKSCELIEDAIIFENLTYNKPGYEFKGWYRDSQFTNLFSADGSDAIMPSENIILYAKWSALSFTINFNANGGTVETNSLIALSGVAIGSLPTPVRTYYAFDGWFTEAEGGTQVTEETIFARTDDIVLYAHWTLNSFIVTFNSNGGSISKDSLRGYCGTKLGKLPTPNLDYYRFDGWFTAIDGGTEITSSTVYNAANDVVAYARWTINPLSNWVVASSVPPNARIENSKWNYTQKEYTNSPESTYSGWTKYDTKRTNWGSWSGWSTSNPSNGVRNVESCSVYDHTEYHYYRWTNGNGVYTYKYDSSYWLEESWFTYALPATSYSDIGYVGNNSNLAKNWWVRADSSCNRSVSKDFTRSINRTEWRYQDPVYTYYYYRYVDKETFSDPAGQPEISNVKKWVRYREK